MSFYMDVERKQLVRFTILSKFEVLREYAFRLWVGKLFGL